MLQPSGGGGSRRRLNPRASTDSGRLARTERVQEQVFASGITGGLANLFLRHTSASLLIQENADPTARDDLERFFAHLVPGGDVLFRHQDGERTQLAFDASLSAPSSSHVLAASGSSNAW
jgi:secondary thiamine-phosphate synthase enzyme